MTATITRGATMQIQTTKKALVGALKSLARIIPAKSTNPLLTHLHIAPGARGLELTGTNLEVDLRLNLPAEIGFDGFAPFTVPAHLLNLIAGKLADELVTLVLEGSQLIVQASGSNFKVQLGDVEAYPIMEFEAKGQGYEVAPSELLASISAVRYAVSSKEYQPVFRGALLVLHPEYTRLVGSDGMRLVVRDTAALLGVTSPRTLIIPGRSSDELSVLLGTANTCTLYPGDGTLTVVTDTATMVMKLIDGEFPDYERVIPKDIKLSASVSVARLLESVDRVSVMANPLEHSRVDFVFADNRAQLDSESEYGHGSDTLETTQTGSEPAIGTAFNAGYLIQALKGMSGEVTLGLSGRASPAILTCAADPGLRAVLVPLRDQ